MWENSTPKAMLPLLCYWVCQRKRTIHCWLGSNPQPSCLPQLFPCWSFSPEKAKMQMNGADMLEFNFGFSHRYWLFVCVWMFSGWFSLVLIIYYPFVSVGDFGIFQFIEHKWSNIFKDICVQKKKKKNKHWVIFLKILPLIHHRG